MAEVRRDQRRLLPREGGLRKPREVELPARWSEHDDSRLGEWYVDGVPVATIARRLGRSPDAVDARRRALDLPARRPRSRRWSPAQDALLRASAEAGVPAAALAERLGLPLETVRRRRRELAPVHQRAKPYAAEEDAALRDAIVGGRALRELASQLGRTEGALRTRARALGLLPKGSRRRWTQRDDELLREGYERGLTCTAVARVMLRNARTAGAVAARARRLGLASYARAWTPEEEESLRRLARGGASLYAAAERHGRTPDAIRRRALKHGVEFSRQSPSTAGRRWTEREDALLRDFSSLHPVRLSRLLGRSDRAVLHRIRALGLANGSPHRLPSTASGVTAGELRLIAQECSDAGPRRVLALARRLGRHPGEVRRLAVRVFPADTLGSEA